MNIQEFKTQLESIDKIQFVLPNGKLIPEYFHITEMGTKIKHFIDCGNTIRQQAFVSFQIWFAKDYDHKLSSKKLIKIINATELLFKNENLEIEVEYQLDMSIGIFSLEFKEGIFYLISKETTCLANDHCGISSENMKVTLKDLEKKDSCCSTITKCC